MLLAEGLQQTLGGRQILRDLSLRLRPGTITAVVGPSGGGKTTLLRTLSCLDHPTAGRITLDDVTYEFPRAARRPLSPSPWPRLTVAFQQYFLWPHMTLAENILFGIGRPDAAQQAWFDEIVETLGIAPLLTRYPHETSGGQKQRAALARAAILRPRYLLLDEITAALDVEQVSIVLGFLRRLKETGTAIMAITHLLGFAKAAADQVLFLCDGTILESGRPLIFSRPRTERMARFLSVVAQAR